MPEDFDSLAAEIKTTPKDEAADKAALHALVTVARELMLSMGVPGLYFGVEICPPNAYQGFSLYVMAGSRGAKETLLSVICLTKSPNYHYQISAPISGTTMCENPENLIREVMTYLGYNATSRRIRYHADLAIGIESEPSQPSAPSVTARDGD